MTTRAEFQAKLAAWSKSPTPANVPWSDIVELAYNTVSRNVFPAELDTSVSLDPSAATEVRGGMWSHAAPADLMKVLTFTNNGTRLRTKRSDALQEWASQSVNRPSFYAVVGTAIWTAPGAGGDLLLVYNKRDAALPQDDSENHGLDAYLEAYMAAGLAHYYEWAEDTENEQRAWDRFAMRRDGLNLVAHQRRHGGGAGQAS